VFGCFYGWWTKSCTRVVGRLAEPSQLKGTVTVTGLTNGLDYAICRWDSVADAFDYARPHSVHRFTASKDAEVYADVVTFSSGGATYYRCVTEAETVLV
jgi:hypothetical protein